METTKILLKDDCSDSEFKILIQNDNTLCFSKIKLLLPNICGIICDDLFLNIDCANNKVHAPPNGWTNRIYYAKSKPTLVSSNLSLEGFEILNIFFKSNLQNFK